MTFICVFMVTMCDDFWHHPYWTFNFIYFLFIIFVWQPATHKFHATLVFLHIYTRIPYTFILLEWNYIYCYTWSKGKPQENGYNIIAGNDINQNTTIGLRLKTIPCVVNGLEFDEITRSNFYIDNYQSKFYHIFLKY